MDLNTFYYGIVIGIIIGFYLMQFGLNNNKEISDNKFNNNKLKNDPIDIIKDCLIDCTSAIKDIRNCQNPDKIPDLIKQKQHILTNRLLQLDQIEDPPLRTLRKTTIVYIQSVQDYIDSLGSI